MATEPLEPLEPNDQTPKSPYLDQIEAAALCRLSPRTLEGYRLRGNGPPYLKVGKKILYTKPDLIVWLERHRRTSTSDPAGDEQ